MDSTLPRGFDLRACLGKTLEDLVGWEEGEDFYLLADIEESSGVLV